MKKRKKQSTNQVLEVEVLCQLSPIQEINVETNSTQLSQFTTQISMLIDPLLHWAKLSTIILILTSNLLRIKPN